jgi:hypothetical protein
MSKIKSYEEFVNENLFGQYSYYGAGSLFPIVQKLATEGKNPEQIYLFLTTIGVDEERKMNVLKKVFLNESLDLNVLSEASRSKFKGKTAHDLYTQMNGKTFEVFIKNDWYSVNPEELKGEKGTSFTGYTQDGSDYEFDVDDIDFIQESKGVNEGGLYEEDDILTADTKDLAKGISPDKAKPDDEVKNAIDKLKNDNTEKKDAEEKPESEVPGETAKIEALKDALKDAQKMEKIKKILSESMGFDTTGLEDEVLESVLDYHKVLEKLSQTEKDKLKPTDFVFPDRKAWPIHDEKHAKTALVWATWPQYADLKKQVVASVLKRYPNLKGVGASK